MIYGPSLPTLIKTINRQLQSHFGIDTDSMNQMWRVVWSDDQYEKRMTDRTNAGIILLIPEIRELPKYQWIRARWVLENLVLVPEFQQIELAGITKSYEPMWTFSNANGEAVAPTFEACKFIIDSVNAAKGKGTLVKYADPDKEHPLEKQMERIIKLEHELFGDESGLEGKTFKGEGVVVPQTYQSTQSDLKGE